MASTKSLLRYPIDSAPVIERESLEAALPMLGAVPYPAMWIDADYQVRWINPSAAETYNLEASHCYAMSHGYSAPCDKRGEPCPKARATAKQSAVSVNHVHSTVGGLDLFRVTAIPVSDGSVFEFHVPLEDVMARDKLTTLYSREFFERISQRQIALLIRMELSYAMVMIDLDHFKRVNDEFGHAVGDEVLKAVGETVSATVRSSDTVGRWGGEELLVFLPATDLQGAKLQAERLRRAIEGIQVPSVNRATTASLGVAIGQAGKSDMHDIIERADTALYQAKTDGRNCVRSIDTDAR